MRAKIQRKVTRMFHKKSADGDTHGPRAGQAACKPTPIPCRASAAAAAEVCVGEQLVRRFEKLEAGIKLGHKGHGISRGYFVTVANFRNQSSANPL